MCEEHFQDNSVDGGSHFTVHHRITRITFPFVEGPCTTKWV